MSLTELDPSIRLDGSACLLQSPSRKDEPKRTIYFFSDLRPMNSEMYDNAIRWNTEQKATLIIDREDVYLKISDPLKTSNEEEYFWLEFCNKLKIRVFPPVIISKSDSERKDIPEFMKKACPLEPLAKGLRFDLDIIHDKRYWPPTGFKFEGAHVPQQILATA